MKCAQSARRLLQMPSCEAQIQTTDWENRWTLRPAMMVIQNAAQLLPGRQRTSSGRHSHAVSWETLSCGSAGEGACAADAACVRFVRSRKDDCRSAFDLGFGGGTEGFAGCASRLAFCFARCEASSFWKRLVIILRRRQAPGARRRHLHVGQISLCSAKH